MTPSQKTDVKRTFAQVLSIADQAAALFYGRLFELDPALRALFKIDMAEQGRKLMQTIGFCVARLDELDEILPTVRELGRKHAGYGVKDADYDTVGAALLWTLEKGLGADFTPEVKAAWTAVYQALAATMRAGASSAAAA
jgi:hemoglobin-like flavoprotein